MKPYGQIKKVNRHDYSQNRLPSLLKRYQKMHINTAKSSYKPIISSTVQDNKLLVTITTDIEGTAIYYTLDGSEPTLASNKYQHLSRLNHTPKSVLAAM